MVLVDTSRRYDRRIRRKAYNPRTYTHKWKRGNVLGGTFSLSAGLGAWITLMMWLAQEELAAG